MVKHIDVLGFELSEATKILNDYNVGFIIKESIGKDKIEQGTKRVIRQKFISDNEIELTISYF